MNRDLSLPSLKKSNSSFMVRFCWNLKRNILICLPIIIEIQVCEQGPPYLPEAPPPLTQNGQILHLWCNFTENWNNMLVHHNISFVK